MDMSTILYWVVGILLGGAAVGYRYSKKIKALIDIIKSLMDLIDIVKTTRQNIEEALKDHTLTKEEIEEIASDLYKIEKKAEEIYEDYKTLTGS